MKIEIDDAILRLGENRNLTLQNNSGACVHVHWGRVWITREGDSKDHIVGSGESLAIGRAGATVLTAMSDSGVSVMQRCNGVAEQDMAANLKFATTRHGDDGEQAFTLEVALPSYQQIDRHLARAKQLRARFVGKLLRGEWRSQRGASNAANNSVVNNSAVNNSAVNKNGANNAMTCCA